MKKQGAMVGTVLLMLACATHLQAMTAEEYQRELERAELLSQSLSKSSPRRIVENPECRAAWASSSAAQSCTTTDYIEQEPVGICVIRADCMKVGYQTSSLPDGKSDVPAQSWQYEEKSRVVQLFPALLGYTSKLVNCDGTLKYVSCD